MAKKKREARAPESTDRGAVAAIAALGVALAGSALAVDTLAASSFDAPKRLVALGGVALAAAAAFAWRGRGPRQAPWREGPPLRRAALWLAAGALGLAFVSALASPRRAISLDAMRTIALMSLLLPLGASRAGDKGRGWLAGVFLASCAVNAAVAVLEGLDVFHPFQLETFGARQNTGAFAGNVGYLAIALALASVLALGLALTARGKAVRAASVGCLAVFAAGLVVNQNLTALSATLAGSIVLLVLKLRGRALLPVAAAVAAVGLAVAGYAPLRQRALALSQDVRIGAWDSVLSFRGGPWVAAVEMTRERPLLGFGPGTFGAEYVPHRLSAEIRARRRFVSPLLTSSYAEAHSDYLQVFSDAGVPAGLLALGAGACLLALVARTAWRRRTPEAIVLCAVLGAGAAAALTWFPLQRPITAVPLLYAAGRAWKISGETAPTEES